MFVIGSCFKALHTNHREPAQCGFWWLKAGLHEFRAHSTPFRGAADPSLEEAWQRTHFDRVVHTLPPKDDQNDNFIAQSRGNLHKAFFGLASV